MIEFEIPDGRVWTIQISAIARFTASGQDATRVILMDGTELVARAQYAQFRDNVNLVRNQFASLVRAGQAS